MKEKLCTAYESVLQKDIQAVADVITMLKALPRTVEGIYDLTGFNEDKYELAAYAYPVYCAYETVCNKKEGYLDLMDQVRAWKAMTDKEYNLKNAAGFLQMLMNTIEQMSPEIYEYYRELVDIFRADMKRVLSAYYVDGSFTENGIVDEAAAEKIRRSIRKACAQSVLLTEKYEQYSVKN